MLCIKMEDQCVYIYIYISIISVKWPNILFHNPFVVRNHEMDLDLLHPTGGYATMALLIAHCGHNLASIEVGYPIIGGN